jgi:AcrR family transcriptional regulator
VEAEAASTEDQPTGGAREKILGVAYDLFSRNGIRAIGVNTIITESGTARQTLYRHFDSKQDLVLAFLERREELWTKEWLQGEVGRRAHSPVQRLLTVFDVFDEWFRRRDFEGCSFINVLLEHPDSDDPVHAASAAQLANIRSFIEYEARAAGIADPADFAREWHILMKGSIVAAMEGDRDAAQRAQRIGRVLLAAHGAEVAVPAA